MRRVPSSSCYLVLLLLITSCGGGGAETAVAPPLEVLSITGPLATGGTAFTITGTAFPGTVTDAVTVRFTATVGTPFDGCRSAQLEQNAVVSAADEITGSTPESVLAGDVDCFVTVEFVGGEEVTSSTAIAHFEGVPDPAYDQDLDGVHDRCDPDTYDFEDDVLDTRPIGTARVDGTAPGFVVADVGGDKVARYSGGAPETAHDIFERLRADYSYQDLTAYIDWGDTPTLAYVELWSDGSRVADAGAGLIVQATGIGEIRLVYRKRFGLSGVIGSIPLPVSGRIRVRLRKGAGITSTMHLDAWENGAWSVDTGVIAIDDDTWFSGREVATVELGDSTRGIKRLTVVREVPSASLTLFQQQEGAADWKVFQRDAADVATIPLRFGYTLAAAGRAEARVVEAGAAAALPGHDWADHVVQLPAGQALHASLDVTGVPAGGNYDVHIRLVDNASGSTLGQAQHSEVAVGDVYLCIGQSNMWGASGSLVGITLPDPEVHMFRNSDLWKIANDPADEAAIQRDNVASDGHRSSLMLPFGKALHDATGIPVGIIPGPLGGSSLQLQWQRDADADRRDTLYGSALRRAALQGGTPIRGILWYQGETDAIAFRTTAQYRADLEQLVAQYRADLGAPDAYFFCVQLGTWISAGGHAGWAAVQEAQRQLCQADARAALATIHDQARADNIHYTVGAYQEIGRRLAEQARVLIFGEALDPLTELTDAVAVSAGTSVELRYDAPVTGGEASLFTVTDAGGLNAVTSVSTSASTVTLQLTRALNGVANVSYGTSSTAAVAWVLDASGVPVPAFANVEIN